MVFLIMPLIVRPWASTSKSSIPKIHFEISYCQFSLLDRYLHRKLRGSILRLSDSRVCSLVFRLFCSFFASLYSHRHGLPLFQNCTTLLDAPIHKWTRPPKGKANVFLVAQFLLSARVQKTQTKRYIYL